MTNNNIIMTRNPLIVSKPKVNSLSGPFLHHNNLRLRFKTKLNFALTSLLLPYINHLNIPKMKLGSEYGGWTICPLGLNSNSIIYSLGIGQDITFDLDLIKEFKCKIFAFDPTPQSIEWLKSQILPWQFKWYELGVADYDGEAKFYPPKNESHISHTILHRPSTSKRTITIKVRRLRTLLQKLRHEHIDILKMDIEGAEYSVIKDMILTNIFPRQILVEFHHFFENISILKTIEIIALLLKKGYRIFHISNSRNEYSFIRNKYSLKKYG